MVDPLVAPQAQRITDTAAKRNVPTIYVGGAAKRLASGGALIAYGPDVFDLLRRSALLVDRILKGARPTDIPVEQPTKFDFIINMKTANALGLTIPPWLLLRADEIIQ